MNLSRKTASVDTKGSEALIEKLNRMIVTKIYFPKQIFNIY